MKGCCPPYLRFVRGVVDTSDLALNVSRETLQHDPILTKIRAGLVKRVLSELAKRAKKEPEEYASFWQNFGAVLKEGLYEDAEQKDRLLPLARFQSVGVGDRWLSLDEYVEAMPEQQEAIYYMSGDDPGTLRRSPQIEGFRARGIDVLLMADPVDQFWLPAVGTYKEKPFRSVTQGASDLDRFALKDEEKTESTDAPADGEIDKLIALVKLTLADAVKDVRISERLTESPVCLVADEGDLDMHLERLLRQHKHDIPVQKRVLEINPTHDLTRALARMVGTERSATEALEDATHLADGPGADPGGGAGAGPCGLHPASLKPRLARAGGLNRGLTRTGALTVGLTARRYPSAPSSQTMSAPMIRPRPSLVWTRTARPSPTVPSASGSSSSVMALPVHEPMGR